MLKRITTTVLFCLIAIVALPKETSAERPAPELKSVRMAIEDLAKSFPEEYAQGKEFLARADELSQQPPGTDRDAAVRQLQREALLANPLRDVDKLLLGRRKRGRTGLPANWQGNESLPKTGYGNDVAVLSLGSLEGELKTVFRPKSNVFVGDLDLHFDGRRLLFSMPGKNGR